MSKSENQKLKLLYLQSILEKRSDEDFPLSTQELISLLGQEGISAERKSVYDDIRALQDFGIDVTTVTKGKSNAYYIGERIFQLPELKLLADAVASSRFITDKKSRQLIEKISSLTSEHKAAALRRQLNIERRVKMMNETIYYSVDKIQAAIAEDKNIRHRHIMWEMDKDHPNTCKKSYRHDGKFYRISPWTLIWSDENYYLLAYDCESKEIKNFRVDKMSDIQILDEPRQGKELYERQNVGEYMQKLFGMFGGEDANVHLRFSNDLIGVVVDHFGKDIPVQNDGASHFTIWVQAKVSPLFFGWLFGMGNKVRILSPSWAAEKMKETLQAVQAEY